eukprot:3104085-Amphidinium_carterae.1
MSEASLGSIRASTRKALGCVGKRSSEIDFIAKGGQPHHLASASRALEQRSQRSCHWTSCGAQATG